MRGSEEWDAGAERPAQQGTATDASAVGKDISEFDGAAGGEMLAGLHEDAEKKHGQACLEAGAAVFEADHRQERKREVGAEVHHLVVDVQPADRGHDGRSGRGQGSYHHTTDERGPAHQGQGVLRLGSKTESRCEFVLLWKHTIFDWRWEIRSFQRWGLRS